MNISGEFVKRQGHISFPLFLDLLPFMAVASTLVQETSMENMKNQWTGRQQEFALQQSQINKQLTMQMLPPIFRIIEQTASVEALPRNNSEKSTNHSDGDSDVKYNLGISKEDAVHGSKVVSSGLDLPFVCSVEEAGSCEKENAIETGDAVTSKSSMYRLSSVVEHYGRYGGGHYAAYRRAMSDSLAEPIEGNCLWFYTSDREVSQVSEETVLAAEATLLFYERI
ncbi:Ubiquitin carboxyl-terminal hydrolase 27 [Ananas comosus]|uniref:ubiquitinyl hydrolase 1 n=1 Tax=Ananas comosus TaxID=4615 RepID=A0A199W5W1_ANACO|nr:Ubiquitin carboxyl-terminal hydrolase 27 [Ananas comosus]